MPIIENTFSEEVSQIKGRSENFKKISLLWYPVLGNGTFKY